MMQTASEAATWAKALDSDVTVSAGLKACSPELKRLRKKSRISWEEATRAQAQIFLSSIHAGLKARSPRGYTLTGVLPQPL
jgi:hypothetical protein